MADPLRPGGASPWPVPTLPATAPSGHPFAGAARDVLERDVLVPYLQRQRWFGGKAREARAASVVDWTALGPGPAAPTLAIVRVRYAGGPDDLYQIATAVIAGPRAGHVLADRPETVLARLPQDDLSLLCDAVMDDEACRAIFEATRRDGRFASHNRGAIVARPMSAEPPDPDGTLGVVRFASTHSNSAVALGGRFLLKIFRRLEVGLNPDIEIGRFLAAHGQSVRVPALVGSIEHLGPGDETTALAMTQRLVHSRSNGWDHALQDVTAFFDRAARSQDRPTPSTAAALAGDFPAAAHRLGRRTAELHRALGSSQSDPDFTPTTASPTEVRALADRLRVASGEAFAVLDRLRPGFDAEADRLAARVLALRPALDARVSACADGIAPFVKIRVHGDYHLGQVLSLEHDFVILDFEGEPTRPLSERRARQSPLRDVSGMLRSFSYAAHAALAAEGRGDDRRGRLAAWADAWIDAVSATFLEGYFEAARGAPFVPADRGQVQALLELFLLDKAVYELDYEMNNRPDWVHIPLRGLLALGSAPPAPLTGAEWS
jgi:trehalose synthase-fused probable maltokinase